MVGQTGMNTTMGIQGKVVTEQDIVTAFATANSLNGANLYYDASTTINAKIDEKVSYAVGDYAYSMAATKSGFLFCGDTQSIGDTSSGANNTGSTYQDLYTLLWDFVIESATSGDKGFILLTSGGTGTTKGASAAADWSANKRIEINLGGLTPVCKDAGDSNFDTLGEVGGESEHTLTIDELAIHAHPPKAGTTAVWGHDGGAANRASGSDWTANTLDDVTGNKGGGGAHNNLQPYEVSNRFIKF